MCCFADGFPHAREEDGRSAGPRFTPEEQGVFSGVARARSGFMVCPFLLDWPRADAEKGASLSKNLQEARAERAALRKVGAKAK
eukprot:3332642-Lingulodinium_polyedra.AAC.1